MTITTSTIINKSENIYLNLFLNYEPNTIGCSTQCDRPLAHTIFEVNTHIQICTLDLSVVNKQSNDLNFYLFTQMMCAHRPTAIYAYYILCSAQCTHSLFLDDDDDDDNG